MEKKIKNELNNDYKDSYGVIPEVDNDNVIPKVIIYSPENDGSYYFRHIGFNRKITDKD